MSSYNMRLRPPFLSCLQSSRLITPVQQTVLSDDFFLMQIFPLSLVKQFFPFLSSSIVKHVKQSMDGRMGAAAVARSGRYRLLVAGW